MPGCNAGGRPGVSYVLRQCVIHRHLSCGRGALCQHQVDAGSKSGCQAGSSMRCSHMCPDQCRRARRVDRHCRPCWHVQAPQKSVHSFSNDQENIYSRKVALQCRGVLFSAVCRYLTFEVSDIASSDDAYVKDSLKCGVCCARRRIPLRP